MTTKKTTKPEATKPAETPAESTPSEMLDDELEAQERRAELLADMPELRPARRFRLAHRNAFHNLSLEALKSGAFDGDNMDFDMEKPADIERFQKLQKFVESIDEWAESIATDIDAYVAWSEGKDEETFLALFADYKEALGDSKRSES